MTCVFLFCVRHIFCRFQNCPHSVIALPAVPPFCSFYIISHCIMFYCPNPSCKRNLRKTKKPFPSDKSFSNHLQQSPECKVFLFEQTSAATLQSPSKQASINTTTNQLFKIQCLWLVKPHILTATASKQHKHTQQHK